jgi:hypothetical protein
MSSKRSSQRVPKPIKFFDEIVHDAQQVSEITTKTARLRGEKRPLKAVKVEPAIGPTIGELISAPLPQYIPPINVPLVPFQAQLPRQGPLSLFLSFLGEPALRTVVENTNSYARNWRSKPLQKRARPWHDLSRNELLRWIGLLFYMGRHTEPQRTDYWRVSGHNLGRYMGMSRWEQIHRFLSIRDEVVFPILPGEPWYYKLEPVASQIRQNCEKAVIPCSWVSVDEGMIPFQGRSRHTVKLRDKPIEEGFKVWICAFGGYVMSWLWHSGLHGPEGIPRKRWVQAAIPFLAIPLAPTFLVPYDLMSKLRSLWPGRNYCVFLDNLFMNVDVAHCLLAIGVGCMGTTRKNAAGLPPELLQLKEEGGRHLVWNSTIGITSGHTLCFLWQDNNAVLGITTSFSLHRQEDKTQKQRKRPKPTSTNATVVLPVFGNHPVKTLDIPSAINAYNHHMNGGDVANQLRHTISCHRPQESKWWRPIWYWLLDICATNAYLLWKLNEDATDTRLHAKFHSRLVEQLLEPDPTVPDGLHHPDWSEHQPGPLQKPTYCAWGKKHPGECEQGGRKKRQFGDEITNHSRPAKRPRQVKTCCKLCGVALCVGHDCWYKWHTQKR